MEKTLKLDRRELVWEYYVAEWTESDWANLLTYYKTRANEADQHPEENWRQKDKQLYERIKDITWEQAVEDFKKYRNGEEQDCIWWNEDHSYTDCSGELHEFNYKVYLADFIEECMRDDCWDNGPTDCEGADDSDEDWYLKTDSEVERI